MRLDKLLASYGIGSRKEVKNYIRKGFVTVNGKIIKNEKEWLLCLKKMKPRMN